jgi:hypothetical protein
MRIPTSLLRQRITVEPYQGTDGVGRSVYGPAVTAPARVEGKRRSIRKANGTEVISTASITVRPDVYAPEESRITAPHPITGDVETFEVLQVLTMQGLSRPVGFEVLVG